MNHQRITGSISDPLKRLFESLEIADGELRQHGGRNLDSIFLIVQPDPSSNLDHRTGELKRHPHPYKTAHLVLVKVVIVVFGISR